MKYRYVSILLILVLSAPGIAGPLECVILLHGLGRSHHSMYPVQELLQRQGYRVFNPNYPSTREPVERLAQNTIQPGVKYCRRAGARKIHFVTHSMGGILLRQYFQGSHLEELGRIVMLAPPNKGSEVVDLLRDYWWFKAAMGPAALQLGTGPLSLPNRLQSIPGEIGIIAGSSSSDPWFSPYIPGEDDGKVAVERARIKEMKDFLIVQAGHSFIMRDQRVLQQILFFLRHGRFATD